MKALLNLFVESAANDQATYSEWNNMSDVKRSATSEQKLEAQRTNAMSQTINASQTINGAQQKCTRARDTTRKQNNAKKDRFIIISVVIFEVNIVTEQKRA